jgi:hypothetical protein
MSLASKVSSQRKEKTMIDQTIQTQLIARTLKDSAFRQKVLNNPKAVLANEYQIRLPEHITIYVLEEAANTLTIVLPPQEEAVQELADSDLEAVAGGLAANTCVIGTGNKCVND